MANKSINVFSMRTIRIGVLKMLSDPSISTEEKWPVFQRLWKATEHTSYARVTKLVMEKFYGESVMSLESLMRLRKKLLKN